MTEILHETKQFGASMTAAILSVTTLVLQLLYPRPSNFCPV